MSYHKNSMKKLKNEIEKIILNIKNDKKIIIKYDFDNIYEFIDEIIDFIFNFKYNKLLTLLKNYIIDKHNKIEYYVKSLFDLYIQNEDNVNKNIDNIKQKIIFWHNDNRKLLYFEYDYYICNVIKFNKKIITFYRNKNINNLPLAIIININGEKINNINFPDKSFNKCINSDIECYFAKKEKKNDTIIIVFINGNCRFDFWCKYSLSNNKYIDWNFWK